MMARFRPKKYYTGQLEILAAVSVYYSWPELFVDRDVIHWIDKFIANTQLLAHACLCAAPMGAIQVHS